MRPRRQLGQRFAVIALENQAEVHYAMPVRSMLYDALDYVDQVRKITQGYRESGETLTGAELLSGLRKEDRLVPVVTIVLYWGTGDWDGCKSIHELLGLKEAVKKTGAENRDKDQLYRYVHENREALRRMGETPTLALLSVIGEQKRLMQLLEKSEKEEPDMCKAIDDLIADGETRGEKRGAARLSTLIGKLLDENRTDLVRQVTCDEKVREQLFRLYGL